LLGGVSKQSSLTPPADNFYEMEIRSGFLPFDGTSFRKRFRRLGCYFTSSDKLEYDFDIEVDCLSDRVPAYKPLLKQPDLPVFEEGLRKIECYIGKQGFVGSFRLRFKNYSEFIIHDIYGDYLLKSRRIRL